MIKNKRICACTGCKELIYSGDWKFEKNGFIFCWGCHVNKKENKA